MDSRETSQRHDAVNEGPVSIGGWLAQHAVSLIIIAVLAVIVFLRTDPVTVGLVILGLGLVIFIHELGHFLAAKWCDVHVETFSIGFGPPLPGCRFQYGETTYQLALVPLGGYVKMVGEGSEEDGEDDPRSFKNKSVGQRMLIISAGVIMNLILAAICFVGVYRTTGVDAPAGVIGTIDSGSPSWQQGLQPGIELTRIGSSVNPRFDDVMPEVMHWPAGQPIPISYRAFTGKDEVVDTEIVPKQSESAGRPMIGIAPAFTTVLRNSPRYKIPPVRPGSAASKAEPPLQNGDRILATSDPDDPARMKPLPPDPRLGEHADRKDYFELARRMHQLANQEIRLQVERASEKDAPAQVEVKIPAAYHTDYGLRMSMRPITAIRKNSPAEHAGIQPTTPQHIGDIISGIEVTETNGTALRFVPSLSPKPSEGVREVILDPVRLPYELQQWARRTPGPKKVKLLLDRPQGHNERPNRSVQVILDWEDGQALPSTPSGPNSPIAIDPLGLAYAISSQVEQARPGSPAESAILTKDATLKTPMGEATTYKAGEPFKLQKGDVVKSVQLFYTDPRTGKEESITLDIAPDQWAHTHWMLQTDPERVVMTLARGDNAPVEVSLQGVTDTSWPKAERGLAFEPDTRLEKAHSLAEAMALGAKRTGRLIVRIYQNLLAMIDGRISFKKNASGPLRIAEVSYGIAAENMQLFVLFIGMISVNLAVINFLPIPVLDGGHMVFLLYEKLRGRPAPETVRVAATFVGLAMIASLMLFVIYLDVKKML